MKKKLPKLFLILSTVFFLILILRISIQSIQNNSTKKSEENNKLYEVFDQNTNFIQTLAYHLLQPLIESRIDYYIQINGIEEHLKKIKNQLQEKSIFEIYDINHGNGKQALCGSEVSVILKKFDTLQPNLSLIHSTLTQYTDNIVNIKIGTHEIKELNYAIEGMKEGGERLIMIKKNKSKTLDQYNNYNSYYIKLLNIKNLSLSSIENLLIFNNLQKNYTDSSIIKCGDTINVKYTLREHDGSILVKDQIIKFTIGEHKIPTAIEFGVLNMYRNSSRSIIVPASLLHNLHRNIKYNRNSIKIIDIAIINE